MEMYCISSATESVIMEVPQKIPIYIFSAALAHNKVSFLIFLNTAFRI